MSVKNNDWLVVVRTAASAFAADAVAPVKAHDAQKSTQLSNDLVEVRSGCHTASGSHN